MSELPATQTDEKITEADIAISETDVNLDTSIASVESLEAEAATEISVEALVEQTHQANGISEIIIASMQLAEEEAMEATTIPTVDSYESQEQSDSY